MPLPENRTPADGRRLGAAIAFAIVVLIGLWFVRPSSRRSAAPPPAMETPAAPKPAAAPPPPTAAVVPPPPSKPDKTPPNATADKTFLAAEAAYKAALDAHDAKQADAEAHQYDRFVQLQSQFVQQAGAAHSARTDAMSDMLGMYRDVLNSTHGTGAANAVPSPTHIQMQRAALHQQYKI